MVTVSNTEAKEHSIRARWGWLGPYLPALLVIFIGWCILYPRGLDFGRPFVQCGDEHVTVRNALNVLRNGNFNTNGSGYPPLQAYILSGLFGARYIANNGDGVYLAVDGNKVFKPLADLSKRDIFDLHYVGRWFSALCAGMTILLVFVVACEFMPKWASLISAFVLLLFPSHIEQAHYVLPNTLNGLLAISATYAAVVFVQRTSIAALYLSVVFSMLAISNKMNVTVMAAPVVAFAFKFQPALIRHIPSLVAMGAAVLVATYPYAFFDPRNFVQHFARVLWSYNYEDTWVRVQNPYYAWTLWLVQQSPVIFYSSLVGVIALLVRFPYAALALFAPSFLYFYTRCGMSYFFPQRDLIPILPFLAVAFGASMFCIFDIAVKFSPRRFPCALKRGLVGSAVVVVSAAGFKALLANSIPIVQQFGTSDPMQLAQKWIETNTSPHTRIFSENYLGPIPLDDETRKVRYDKVARFGNYLFEQTLASYGDVEYAVSAYTGAYDAYPWLRELRLSVLLSGTNLRKADLLQEYLARNRKLLERRLLREEELGNSDYRKVAEWGVGWPKITIYRVPELIVSEFSPEELLRCVQFASNTEQAVDDVVRDGIKLTQDQAIALPVLLPAAPTDVFVLAQGKYETDSTVPEVELAIGSEPSARIDAIFTYFRQYSAVSTVEEYPRSAVMNIRGITPLATQVMLRNIALTSVVNSSNSVGTPGAEIEFGNLGPNLLQDGEFEAPDSVTNIWKSSATDGLVVASDTSCVQGKFSLRAEMKNSLNFASSQLPIQVTPGRTYILKGYVRVRDIEGNACIEAQDADGGWTSFLAATNGVTANTFWCWVYKRVKVPEHVNNVRIMLRRPNSPDATDSSGVIWFDSVGFHELEPGT